MYIGIVFTSIPTIEPMRLHSQLRKVPSLSRVSPGSLNPLSRSMNRKREKERNMQVELADSRHAVTGKPDDVLHCDATNDVYRPSIIQRHVPVIAHSACNITKHRRDQTCKQCVLPFTFAAIFFRDCDELTERHGWGLSNHRFIWGRALFKSSKKKKKKGKSLHFLRVYRLFNKINW